MIQGSLSGCVVCWVYSIILLLPAVVLYQYVPVWAALLLCVAFWVLVGGALAYASKKITEYNVRITREDDDADS
jgi:hypothetical protein